MGRGHLHLHPAWLQLLTADKQLIYISIMPPHQVTSDFITAPTGGTCGGASLSLHHCLLFFSIPPSIIAHSTIGIALCGWKSRG